MGGTARRYEGLDLWRSILLLIGILLHATTINPTQNALFEAIHLGSGSFRMGAFFMISGFLSAAAMQRRGSGEWLRRRLIVLGVPLLTGAAVFAPLMSLVTARRWGWDYYSMIHLWFLPALLGSTALVKLIEPMLARIGRLRPTQLQIFGGAAILSFIGRVAGSFLMGDTEPGFFNFVLDSLKNLLTFAPFFVLGNIMFRSDHWLRAFVGSIWPSLVMLAGAAFLFAALYAWHGTLYGDYPAIKVVRGLVFSFAPLAAGVLILHSALAIRSIAPFVKSVAAASYTIYLTHLPLLVLIQMALRSHGMNAYLQVGIEILLCAVLTYAIHWLVVERSGIAAFLLNGRQRGLRTTATASAS